MPGFHFLSAPLSLSPCDCMCSLCQWMLMLWILSLGALSNTHATEHKHRHTPTSNSQCWTLAAPLWLDQHPSCVLCHSHAGDTLLGGHSLYLIGCCCGFAIHLRIVALVMPKKLSPAQPGHPVWWRYPVPTRALLQVTRLLPDVEFQLLGEANW